jgi:hypothetical protein
MARIPGWSAVELAFLKVLEASTGVAQIALEIEGIASLPRALGMGILLVVRTWREP